jgi:hypothetical protein
MDGEPIYDATYSIDERRMRIAPPVRSDGPPDGCLWFFGGSYTLGEGVQDNETMPYLVGLKTGGRYAVRNFAFHGYGAHQMLAQLRTGESEDRAGCEPTHVLYQGAIWHALRVAGRVSWGEDAPRFVLDDDGSLVHRGKVKDIDFGGPPEKVLKRLQRSEIYTKHLAKYVDPRKKQIDDEDVRLLFAVVEESASLIARAYPDAEFHVIFWDLNPWERNDLYVELLGRRGIPMHRVSAAIPDYEPPKDARYHVHPVAGPPSALAHDRISDYVVREILKSEPLPSPAGVGSH